MAGVTRSFFKEDLLTQVVGLSKRLVLELVGLGSVILRFGGTFQFAGEQLLVFHQQVFWIELLVFDQLFDVFFEQRHGTVKSVAYPAIRFLGGDRQQHFRSAFATQP